VLFHLPKQQYQFRVVGLLLFLVTVGAAAACPETDREAMEWLDKMSRNMRQINYQGVVNLQRDGELQVMEISHFVGDGHSAERLTELTGQGAQIERGAHPLDCIHPGDQLLRLGTLVQNGDCGIAERYRFSVTEGERVAGRDALRINIEPRDMYRFGYAMELDRETGILLKSRTIGYGQQILETMQFANISYEGNSQPGSSLKVIHEARHPNPDSPSNYGALERAWEIRWIPRGFRATDFPLGISGRRTYTDGLAVFSVFMEDLAVAMPPGEGLVRRGGTTVYTRGMLLAGRPVLVTVIGEVPVNTARMVADSVGWVQ
jgi:sigma-E factor negative regulatory protein RseB